jgi:amino acid transporter
MSEEVADASRVIPKAIMLSVAINGSLGFSMLIAVLFCVGNLKDALNSPTGYPFMEIFYQATNSPSGALAMCSIVLIIYCCALMGMLAASSRQLWSFARDRGVPGWRWWSQVRKPCFTGSLLLSNGHCTRFPYPGRYQSTPSYLQ